MEEILRWINGGIAVVAFAAWFTSTWHRWSSFGLRYRLITLSCLFWLFAVAWGSMLAAFAHRPVTVATFATTVACLLSLASQVVPGGYFRELHRKDPQ